MGTGTQSAINSTEALLEVKRQTKEALLKKEQLMIEHKKALARVKAMQMLQGLQIKARELARTLKQEASAPRKLPQRTFLPQSRLPCMQS